MFEFEYIEKLGDFMVVDGQTRLKGAELAIFLAFGPLLTLGTGYAISAETIGFLTSEFYMLLLLGVPFGFLTTNIFLLLVERFLFLIYLYMIMKISLH